MAKSMEWSRLFFQQVPWVQKQIIRAANATRTEYSLSKPKQWIKFPARRHGGSWCFEPWENMEGLKQLHLVIRTRESLWLLPRKCWRAWSRIQHLPGPLLAARVVRGSWVCMADTNISLPVNLYAFSRYTILLTGINLTNVGVVWRAASGRRFCFSSAQLLALRNAVISPMLFWMAAMQWCWVVSLPLVSTLARTNWGLL